jgi:hypothetical protein
LDEFLPRLEGAMSSATGELHSCYDALILDFEAMSRDTSGFRHAMRGMCKSMQIEKRADKGAMSEDDFRSLRKHTVAVPAYTECWRTIRGIAFSPQLGETVVLSGILDLACEIVYLVNDIGSLGRDEQTAHDDPTNADSNFVRLRARALGDRDAALAEVIRLDNQRIADFQRAEQLLLRSEHGADPSLHAYLNILRCTVNGNLATTKHLVPFRYQGASEALSRIQLL